jgi:linoleoyl-CoA desaturase
VRQTIQLQRGLAAGGRIALFASKNKIAWVAGTAMLAVAKIIENMELGHNITHGQWDWMNDPEIHSTEWEWDSTCPSVQWKRSHNFIHHKYTNIVGMDDDVGYGIMRVTRDEPWKRWMLGNPIYNLLLGTLFQWGVAATPSRIRQDPQEAENLGRGAKRPAGDRQKSRQAGRQGLHRVPGLNGT